MFGESASESPRLPSPWLALSQTGAPSPSTEPIDLNDTRNGLGGLSDKLSQSLSSSFSSLSISPASFVESELKRRMSEGGEGGMPRLVPEVEDGNIEYKLKLIAPSPDRFARLVTQLKWRLLEGGGQAIYEIGVADSGQLVGLTQDELEESLETLERMAGELGATVLISRAIEVPVLKGRIEGAGRVRATPTPSPFAPHVNLKYNHKPGREWEGEKLAAGAGKRKEKKMAIKARKREQLAGSTPPSSTRCGFLNGAGSDHTLQIPPRTSPSPSNSDSSPLPSNTEDELNSGSDSAFYFDASPAVPGSPASVRSVSGTPPPIRAGEMDRRLLKPRQPSTGGDPLLKAMAKRMKRDQARERMKGGVLAVQPHPQPPPLSESEVNTMDLHAAETKKLGVDVGLAAHAMPIPLTAAHVSLADDLDGIGDERVEDEDDMNTVTEEGRWIVEVQVLRKIDADAGEGFLDFEGFSVE